MNIYRENILEHYKSPENFGVLLKPTIKYKEQNTLCGDEIQIEVKLNKTKVEKAKFIGKGCAISQASADLLINYAKGRSLGDIKKMGEKDILKLLKIKLTPTRMKCALLPLLALQKGIKEYEK